MNYSPLTDVEKQEMLKVVGCDSVDQLFLDIPREIWRDEVPLPAGLSEMEALDSLKRLASPGMVRSSFAGAGAYQHYIPSAVDHLTSRSEFYTAYTPYQPEVSQGTLTAIFEFQTMICRLTGLDVANASLYDGATATAEALLMSLRKFRKKTAAVSRTLHPHYIDVLKTYCWANDIEIIWIDELEGLTSTESLKSLLESEKGRAIGAVLVQSPNFYGQIEKVSDFSFASLFPDAKKAAWALIQVVTEPFSMALLKNGRAVGVDVVCGEASSFGNPVGFGGPCLGFLAADNAFLRIMPGRLAGRTVDADGNPCFALTLQTREQHIRREKATSNICSNEGLCALRAAVFLSLTGKKLRDFALLNRDLAHRLRKGLLLAGFKDCFGASIFNEWMMELPDVSGFMQRAVAEGIVAGVPLSSFYSDEEKSESAQNRVLFCTTELNSPVEIDQLIEIAKQHMKGAKS